MKLRFKEILVVLVMIGCTIGDERPELVPTCKKMMISFAKKQLKVFSECLKELKSQITDRKEIAEKIQCAVKCVLEKEGLLDDMKKVTKDTMQVFMDKNVPKMYHDISHELMEHCLLDHGPNMDHDDIYCIAYGEFVECVQNVVADVC